MTPEIRSTGLSPNAARSSPSENREVVAAIRARTGHAGRPWQRCTGLALSAVVVLATLAAPARLGGAGAATAAEVASSVALVIDASGSMKAALDAGRTRMDGAKSAAVSFLAGLPPDTSLWLWAYGNRSATEARDCADIGEIAPAGPVGAVREAATAAIGTLAARGYTPISEALTRAARGFGAPNGGPRTIVLVSDGKETCQADPCATAAALARADAGLVVHTVGLGVDAATRGQLSCIAETARGRYFDAATAGELTTALATAGRTAAAAPAVAPVAAPKPGRLLVKRSGGHRVFDSETEKEVAFVASGGDRSVDLPAGIYNVRFLHGALWRGIRVKSGETTTIAPGVLKLSPPLNDHSVRDAETGEELGFLPRRAEREAVLIPGTYELAFGKGRVLTLTVAVEPDRVTEVTAGAVEVAGPIAGFWPLLTEDGRVVDEFNGAKPVIVVPPGRYQVRTPGGTTAVTVAPSATTTVRP